MNVIDSNLKMDVFWDVWLSLYKSSVKLCINSSGASGGFGASARVGR